MKDFDGVNGRPNDERAFVHKFLLGVGSKLLKGVGSVAPGPAGAIFRGAGNVLNTLSQPRARALPTGTFPGQINPLQPSLIVGGPRGGAPPSRITEQFIPQPGSGTQLICDSDASRLVMATCGAGGGGRNGRVNEAGQCAPPGFHWNKSGYTRIGGPCSTKPAGFVERGSELVRNRRKFNTANGPARKRAIARLKASEGDCKDALRAVGYRTISKQSSREMKMRRTRHR